MYDLTFLSIMRDSSKYIDRYFQQINSLFVNFEKPRLIICEGDSKDNTLDKLIEYAKKVSYTVTIGKLDNGTRKWASNDHPMRWKALEAAWNANLKMLKPCKYVICCESDLIWSASTALELINKLQEKQVIAPMLMHNGLHYDLNAMRLLDKRKKMTPQYPYFPFEHERFVKMSRLGGMLVSNYEDAKDAFWTEKCTLKFKEGVEYICDTALKIEHP